MAIERILGTDTGKAAFEKTDRNAAVFETQINNLNVHATTSTDVETYISNLDTFLELNKYVGVNDTTLNKPLNLSDFCKAINIGFSGGAFTQVLYTRKGNVFTRGYAGWENPQWTTWKQLVTTEKTEMDIPLASGFTADTATVSWKHKIVRNGDGSYDLWFAVKKTDNSNIPTGYIQIGSMVAGHIPNAFYIGNGLSVENDTSFAVGFCYVDNSRLMFHNIFASAKSLRGYIRFRTN